MRRNTIGIVVAGATAAETVSNICRAEQLGIEAVWLTSEGGGGDPLTVLAAAASRTERVLLGTAVLLMWGYHPVALARQARVIDSLAPGRLRLGIGPGHRRPMERSFGVEFSKPLARLREYIRVVKTMLQRGSVDVEGRYYTAHATIPEPLDIPIMGSALRRLAFHLCGTESDGAITWLCPFRYLRNVAMPSLRDAALGAGREIPPLIVHAPVCVHENVQQVRNAVREQLGFFPLSATYARMFRDAGFPDTLETGWTDEMIDAVTVAGDERAVVEKLGVLFRDGASEIMATVLTVGEDRTQSAERTIRLLAQVSSP